LPGAPSSTGSPIRVVDAIVDASNYQVELVTQDHDRRRVASGPLQPLSSAPASRAQVHHLVVNSIISSSNYKVYIAGLSEGLGGEGSARKA